jgi:16S rRNA (uracil1498-N3)-methyltransferase
MSTPRRFFVDFINYPEEKVIELSGEEFIHAKTVLRVEEGSEITLLDNSGNEYTAIVAKIEKRSLSAHITGVNVGDKEATTPIYLLCGALKGDKTELVVQKATELGVKKIGVFSSEYCSAYMNENKLDRLNKVAKEAAKQCLRSVAPEVVYFDKFEDALASAKDYTNKLFACEFATSSDVDMTRLSGSCALVVGSEGGFAESEFELAKGKYDFKGITLGKRILRAETAAIAMCSVVAFELGELR